MKNHAFNYLQAAYKVKFQFLKFIAIEQKSMKINQKDNIFNFYWCKMAFCFHSLNA